MSRGGAFSALADASPACCGAAGGCCGGGGCCCCAVEVALPLSAGRLKSTSDPKLSVPCDGSGRAAFCGAVWKDGLAAASGVTLSTEYGLSHWNWQAMISKDRATRCDNKYRDISICY